jgi:hypothetical protein
LTIGVIVSCLGGRLPETCRSGRRRPHLQAYKDFDITWVASGLRGGDATLLQGGRELRPFLLQLVTGAFFVSQTLSERRIQTQTVAHLRGRTTGGLDVETGDLVGNGKQ